VASVAIGHSWSVTFGDMGVIFQTLIGVSKMEAADLAPSAGLMLGAACLLCGLAAARLLVHGPGWWKLAAQVVGIGLLMAVVQFGLAVAGLSPLAALGAGLAGIGAAIVISQKAAPGGGQSSERKPTALFGALASYGGLAILLTLIAWPGPLRDALYPVALIPTFPEVITRLGFVTPAGSGQIFRPLVHPGTAILLGALLSYGFFRRSGLCQGEDLAAAARATWRSAAPASLGILSTVCLSTLMEHAGMTQLLAQGAADLMGGAFPLVSPLVGILGAFATGSNNNSNVLFAPLQKSAAILLGLDPRLLLATQTAGGALGSMLAPAKITVGCSTVGLKGHEGEVLRRTLGVGLIIGLLLGMFALLLS
jgi:lactate permease